MPPYENRPGWGKFGERMKSDIEALRQALAAGPTSGPWFTGDWDNDFGDNLVIIEAHEPEVLHPGQSSIWPGGIVHRKIAETADGEQPLVDAAYIAAASPDRIARLLDALELAQRDADRYRFLNRDFSVMGANIDGNHSWAYRRNFSLRGPTLDAAIDEAMKDKP